MQGASSEDSKPTVSKLSKEDTSPPSPRTLKAIHAGINDSSDEGMMNQDTKDGSVSPRTQLAIHQALAEDEDSATESRTLISSLPTELHANTHHPVSLVVINSSEEETEPDMKSLPNEKSDFEGNLTSQSLHVKDCLFVSSSEDEMEEVIGQRNKALRFAALQRHEKELKLEEETKKTQLTEDIMTGSRGKKEKEEELERRESEHRLVTENGDLVQSQSAAVSSPNTLSINLSAERKTESHHLPPEQRSNEPLEVLEQRNGEVVKSESSEESESEGTVTSQF